MNRTWEILHIHLLILNATYIHTLQYIAVLLINLFTSEYLFKSLIEINRFKGFLSPYTYQKNSSFWVLLMEQQHSGIKFVYIWEIYLSCRMDLLSSFLSFTDQIEGCVVCFDCTLTKESLQMIRYEISGLFKLVSVSMKILFANKQQINNRGHQKMWNYNNCLCFVRMRLILQIVFAL